MHGGAGSLAHDQDARRPFCPQHRPGAEGQFSFAQPTGADLGKQSLKVDGGNVGRSHGLAI